MKLISLFIVLTLPLIIILTNLLSLAYDKNFYLQIYKKTNIYSNFSSPKLVEDFTNNLISYFRTNIILEQDFFSDQAKLHLADVKRLLHGAKIINLISIIILIISLTTLIIKKQQRLLTGSLLYGSVLTLVMILMFSILAAFNFTSAFEKFHRIFFTNNLWLFPPDDNLIKFFPEQFFITFFNGLALRITIISGIIAISTYFLGRKLVTKNH